MERVREVTIFEVVVVVAVVVFAVERWYIRYRDEGCGRLLKKPSPNCYEIVFSHKKVGSCNPILSSQVGERNHALEENAC